MQQNIKEVCPVCNVTIIKGPRQDQVLFSVGPPGTRAQLWAKVCQYSQKPNCINKNKDVIGEVKPDDYYQSEI